MEQPLDGGARATAAFIEKGRARALHWMDAPDNIVARARASSCIPFVRYEGVSAARKPFACMCMLGAALLAAIADCHVVLGGVRQPLELLAVERSQPSGG